MCLNGQWEFEIDQADSGFERGVLERALRDQITVPFAPESALSGIGAVDFLEAVWYRRRVTIPARWENMRVLLHFEAVDHDATVWVNNVEAGRHRGGFSGFTVDISPFVAAGEHAEIVVRARDTHHGPQARGKQSTRLLGYEALYPRTTGIWQTVWLEPVPEVHLGRPRITPHVDGGWLGIDIPVSRNAPGFVCRVVVSDAAGEVAASQVGIDRDRSAQLVISLPPERQRLWSPADPHLYDVVLQLLDAGGRVIDEARSYAGLRSITIDGTAVLINGAPVFQRLVLDQGWYPDGLMTAPTDAALVRDIELGREAGFVGARLHQKVFEERYLYHADRLGYLVWAEFGDWGCNVGGPGDNQRADAAYITQWLEVLERDYSHPSIIGWCPLNETFQTIDDHITALDDVARGMFLATKAMDLTRPVLDASGYSHRVRASDIYDSHSYEQNPERFAEQMAGLASGAPYVNAAPDGAAWSIPYAGQPYFCSEFGGIWWSPGDQRGKDLWSYGEAPATEQEWYDRFMGLVEVLAGNPLMFGYCFTQLTDVFQERNGLYRFDRSTKLDVARVKQIQSRTAAFESWQPDVSADQADSGLLQGAPLGRPLQ